MKLLVRNLARTTTQDEILSLFSAHGKVDECSLVLDKETGQSKGFAFVEMSNSDDAQKALKSLHHATVANNKIRVKLAQD